MAGRFTSGLSGEFVSGDRERQVVLTAVQGQAAGVLEEETRLRALKGIHDPLGRGRISRGLECQVLQLLVCVPCERFHGDRLIEHLSGAIPVPGSPVRLAEREGDYVVARIQIERPLHGGQRIIPTVLSSLDGTDQEPCICVAGLVPNDP